MFLNRLAVYFKNKCFRNARNCVFFYHSTRTMDRAYLIFCGLYHVDSLRYLAVENYFWLPSRKVVTLEHVRAYISDIPELLGPNGFRALAIHQPEGSLVHLIDGMLALMNAYDTRSKQFENLNLSQNQVDALVIFSRQWIQVVDSVHRRPRKSFCICQ